MHQVLISEKESGQRLDKFLQRYLPAASAGFLYKMLRRKNITVNKKKTEGRYLLRSGDSIELFFSDETLAKFQEQEKAAPAAAETAPAPVYRGHSYMRAFRLTSALVFLLLGIPQILNFVMSEMPAGCLNISNCYSEIVILAVSYAVPCLASLIFQKPTKGRSVILSVILGMCLVSHTVLYIMLLVNTYGNRYAAFLEILKGLYSSGVHISLLFAELMALISIAQPKRLIGAPEETAGRSWKFFSGMIGALNSILVLALAISGTILQNTAGDALSAVERSICGGVSWCWYYLFIAVLMGAIVSMSSGAGNRGADFCNIFTHVLVISELVAFALIVVSPMLTNLWNAGPDAYRESILAAVILILFACMSLWYTLNFFINLGTFLKKRQQ